MSNIPEHGVLNCAECVYFDHNTEMCLHPDGVYSDECVWDEEVPG